MFLITLLSSFVLAQSTTNVTNIEYEPVGVNAANQGPGKSLIHEVKRPISIPMITLRNDFHTEMLQSAELIE